MDANTATAIERLKFWEQRFEEILGTLWDGRSLAGEQKSLARERLTKLKDGLLNESNDLKFGGNGTTLVERTILEPALRQAAVEIKSKSTSTPNGRWYDDLRGALVRVTDALHVLERPDQNKAARQRLKPPGRPALRSEPC